MTKVKLFSTDQPEAAAGHSFQCNNNQQLDHPFVQQFRNPRNERGDLLVGHLHSR